MNTVLIHVGFSRFTEHKKQQKVVNFTKKTSHFSAVILRIHLHTNKEVLFSLNIHLRMPDKNSLKPYDLWKTHTILQLRHCRKIFAAKNRDDKNVTFYI